VNSSVISKLLSSVYFSQVIEVFFRCYFRITGRFMLRSQDELNIPLCSVWLKTSVSFHKDWIHTVNEEDKEFESTSLIIPWFGWSFSGGGLQIGSRMLFLWLNSHWYMKIKEMSLQKVIQCRQSVVLIIVLITLVYENILLGVL